MARTIQRCTLSNSRLSLSERDIRAKGSSLPKLYPIGVIESGEKPTSYLLQSHSSSITSMMTMMSSTRQWGLRIAVKTSWWLI